MANKDLILKDLKNILSDNLEGNLKDIFLFGSQLTSKENDDSDFDILIVLRQKPDWVIEKKISDLCYEIDLKYGIITDTHILGETELNSLRGKQPVFSNAIDKGYRI
jgi:predicted nucleotidyltransferase